MARLDAPLQVMGFLATPRGAPGGGPQVRMRSDDAARRLLNDGDLAWVYGPRRQELATVVIDDAVPRGGVVVRDLAGLAVSEIVRVMRTDFDRPTPRPTP